MQDYSKASKKRLESIWNGQRDNDGPNQAYPIYYNGVEKKL